LAAFLGLLLWGASGHADITNTTPYDYDSPPRRHLHGCGHGFARTRLLLSTSPTPTAPAASTAPRATSSWPGAARGARWGSHSRP